MRLPTGGVDGPTDLQGGRLLVYFPDEDLGDGAAQLKTAGFFDARNTPPWDCWIAFLANPESARYADCLLSYVPSALIDLVAQGLDANPEDCVAWLENTDVSLDNIS
jgi:hypothetical protein